MEQIVTIQLSDLSKLLAEKKIEVRLHDAACAHLAAQGYDPLYGARPLKRVIKNEIQNPLATLYLEGKIQEGDMVSVKVGQHGLEFVKEAAEAA